MTDPRTAVITGAGAGIGRSTVEMMTARGWRIVAVDRDADALARYAEHDDVLTVVGDITDEAVVHDAVDAALGSGGRLDAFVAVAGHPGFGSIETMTLADARRTLAVNVRAAFVALRASRLPLSETGGSIVLVGSASGLKGEAQRWAYCSAKAALVNLGRSAAMELAADKVRVNVVCPGLIETSTTRPLRDDPDRYPLTLQRIPLQRWGRPEEVAEVIAFLCSAEAGYVHGAVISVDGGAGANGSILPIDPVAAPERIPA